MISIGPQLALWRLTQLCFLLYTWWSSPIGPLSMIKLTSKMISCSTRLGCLLVLTQLLLQVLLLGLFPSSGSGSITLAGIENTTISWVVLLMVVHKLWCSFYHLQSLELLAFRGLSQMYVQTPHISNISAKAVTYLISCLIFQWAGNPEVGNVDYCNGNGALDWLHTLYWDVMSVNVISCIFTTQCFVTIWVARFYNLGANCSLFGSVKARLPLIFKVRSYVIKYSSWNQFLAAFCVKYPFTRIFEITFKTSLEIDWFGLLWNTLLTGPSHASRTLHDHGRPSENFDIFSLTRLWLQPKRTGWCDVWIFRRACGLLYIRTSERQRMRVGGSFSNRYISKSWPQ